MRLNISITTAVRQMLVELAESRGVSLSEQIRHFIIEAHEIRSGKKPSSEAKKKEKSGSQSGKPKK